MTATNSKMVVRCKVGARLLDTDQQGIEKLVLRYDECLDCGGDWKSIVTAAHLISTVTVRGDVKNRNIRNVYLHADRFSYERQN